MLRICSLLVQVVCPIVSNFHVFWNYFSVFRSFRVSLVISHAHKLDRAVITATGLSART
jgi:hypothetical protein